MDKVGAIATKCALVIDADRESRRGAARMIRTHGWAVKTAGTLASAKAALSSLIRTPGAALELVLLDPQLPDGDGVEAARIAYQWDGRPMVSVITTSLPVQRRAQLEQVGVQQWLTKPLRRSDIATIVSTANRFGCVADGAAAGEATAEDPATTAAKVSEHWGLSPTQKSIFHLVLRGRTHKEVAGELSMSPSSVNTHWGRIREKAQECGDDVGVFERIAEVFRRIYPAWPRRG